MDAAGLGIGLARADLLDSLDDLKEKYKEGEELEKKILRADWVNSGVI